MGGRSESQMKEMGAWGFGGQVSCNWVKIFLGVDVKLYWVRGER